MEWLKRHDFQVISLKQLADNLASGAPFTERTVVLTFDDGYQCLFEHAFPVLDSVGFSATIFLVVNHCGGENDWAGQPSGIPRLPILTWQEIRSVDRELIDFGSHTLNHPRLDQLDGLTLENEICSSKHIIEDQLGHSVSTFCYPYGRISMKAKALVQSAYQAACSTRIGLVSEYSDQYQLERVEIKYLSPTFIFTGIDEPWLKPYLMARRGIRSAASAVFNRQWN